MDAVDVVNFMIPLALVVLVWLAARSVCVVPAGHVGLVERSGLVRRQVGPGLTWRRPFGERLRRVDLRPQRLELSREPVVASDDRVVLVDATVVVQVHDAERATYGVEDHRRALARVAVVSLRGAGGAWSADQLLGDGERLRAAVLSSCRRPAVPARRGACACRGSTSPCAPGGRATASARTGASRRGRRARGRRPPAGGAR